MEMLLGEMGLLAGLSMQIHVLLHESCSDDAGGENGLDLQVLEPIPTPLHQKSRRGEGTEEEKEEENGSLQNSKIWDLKDI